MSSMGSERMLDEDLNQTLTLQAAEAAAGPLARLCIVTAGVPMGPLPRGTKCSRTGKSVL
jgi:hypothetical protein